MLAEDGTYVDLEDEKEYSVVKLLSYWAQILGNASHFCLQVTPNYIASGGDGYKFELWKTRDRILGSLDTEVLSFSHITGRGQLHFLKGLFRFF